MGLVTPTPIVITPAPNLSTPPLAVANTITALLDVVTSPMPGTGKAPSGTVVDSNKAPPDALNPSLVTGSGNSSTNIVVDTSLTSGGKVVPIQTLNGGVNFATPPAPGN